MHNLRWSALRKAEKQITATLSLTASSETVARRGGLVSTTITSRRAIPILPLVSVQLYVTCNAGQCTRLSSQIIHSTVRMVPFATRVDSVVGVMLVCSCSAVSWLSLAV